jgi:hypothetical protein
MSDQDISPQQTPSPWRFVNLSQYRVPPEPTGQAMRKGLLGIWDRLKRTRVQDRSPTIEIDLEYMPGDLLAEAAPAPDWQEGVPALHEALQDWWQERSGKFQVLVGAPYSGTSEIASHWASAFGCPVLPDPPLEEIKAGGHKWLEQLDKDPDRVWVIPRLERFYLRHSQGLALLRVLLDKITCLPTRFLLACDSWAWAYLSKSLHLEALFPTPLVLGAFNQDGLDRWFRVLALRTTAKEFVFRQADNGSLVVHPAEVFQAEGSKPERITEFLQRLAAFSRGNPGVAYAIWRYSLRLAQNKEVQEKTQEAAVNDGLHRTIWVEPWSQLNLPSLPTLDRRDRALFVLHALLLHDGLPGKLLAQILPFPESQTQGSLQTLRVAGVVSCDQDRWRVAAAAYPGVREFLRYEGYLVDDL